MTRLTDEELARHLERRLDRAPLDEPARGSLLRAISQRTRALPRSRHLFAWRTWRLATAGVAVVVVALLVALALPRLGVPDPAASPSAGSPSPSAAVTSLRVYTASEVSALAGDTANDGRIVIMSLEPGGFVAVRMADRLVQIGSVTLLGSDQGAWTVPDVLGYRGGQDVGLVPVHGWLVETSPVSCPAPDVLFDEDESNDDLSYYCQGSWLSSEPVYTLHRSGNGSGTFLLEVPRALHVQVGAYNEFANEPAWGERGAEPRQGIYLLRATDCPAAVTGDCPVWEMVARLEPPPGT